MHDALGDRMKSYYESRTKQFLMRKTNTIIRIDGKAFHTYTKGLERPFDRDLMADMDETAKYLCQNISGVKLAFVQSDEISLLLTDYDSILMEPWFDNNVQKICSVSASMATNAFNHQRLLRCKFPVYAEDLTKMKKAEFDSRVFQIPQQGEVINYFIWRQQDTTRNSIQAVAQYLYSQKELQGKNVNELQDMIFKKGVNWNDYDIDCKRGRLIYKECYYLDETNLDSVRSRWVKHSNLPIFTEDRTVISSLIPVNM